MGNTQVNAWVEASQGLANVEKVSSKAKVNIALLALILHWLVNGLGLPDRV